LAQTGKGETEGLEFLTFGKTLVPFRLAREKERLKKPIPEVGGERKRTVLRQRNEQNPAAQNHVRGQHTSTEGKIIMVGDKIKRRSSNPGEEKGQAL